MKVQVRDNQDQVIWETDSTGPVPSGSACVGYLEDGIRGKIIDILGEALNQAKIESDYNPDNHCNIRSIIEKWRCRAAYYLKREETESDPLGKKFFQTSSIVLDNCRTEMADALGIRDIKKEDELWNRFIASSEWKAEMERLMKNRLEALFDRASALPRQ